MWKKKKGHKVQEGLRVPSRINTKRKSTRYTVIKMAKTKDREY